MEKNSTQKKKILSSIGLDETTVYLPRSDLTTGNIYQTPLSSDQATLEVQVVAKKAIDKVLHNKETTSTPEEFDNLRGGKNIAMGESYVSLEDNNNNK